MEGDWVGVIVIWNVRGEIVYTNATPEDIYRYT